MGAVALPTSQPACCHGLLLPPDEAQRTGASSAAARKTPGFVCLLCSRPRHQPQGWIRACQEIQAQCAELWMRVTPGFSLEHLSGTAHFALEVPQSWRRVPCTQPGLCLAFPQRFLFLNSLLLLALSLTLRALRMGIITVWCATPSLNK